MIWKILLSTMMIIPTIVGATDLKPWFPRSLEFQSRLTYLHQQYTKVDIGDGTRYKRAKDDFYTASLQLAYAQYCGEVEVTFAGTGRHHLGPNDVSATFRYQIFDDVIGDPVSFVVGMTLSQVFSLALKDISTFNTGGIEGEIHAAIGKECSTWETWLSRWWAVAALGVGDHGSPWLRGEAAWEKQWFEQQRLRLFAHLLYGLGDHNIDPIEPFDGYGSIRYQAVDLGTQYRYTFECDASLTLGYIRRVHSTNCPKDVNIYYIQYLYPFGL